MMKVVAFGRTETLFSSIIELASSGNKIELIITSESTQYQYEKDINDFKNLAKELNSKFIVTKNLLDSEIKNLILALKPDIAISVNWPTLVPSTFIDFFPSGILNAHAGDLPRFKGNAVRNWALLSGEKRMALTLHLMDADLDSGPILIKEYCEISNTTKIGDLYNFVQERTPKLFSKALKGIGNGQLHPKSQPTDANSVLRCYPRLPCDSHIDWRLPASDIDRLVRASSEPFNGAFTYLVGEKFIIWRSRVFVPEFDYLSSPGQVVDRDTLQDTISVATGSGFLVIEECESSSFGRTKPIEVVKTLRTRFGLLLDEELTSLRKELEKYKNL